MKKNIAEKEAWRVQSFDEGGVRHEHRVFLGEDGDLRAVKYLRSQLRRYVKDGWTFAGGILENYDLTLRASLYDDNGLVREFECARVFKADGPVGWSTSSRNAARTASNHPE